MGYEQVEDREPFCFLAEAVSGQQNQWGQSHRERSHAHQQPRDHCLKDGGHYFTGERQLFRGAVPPISDSAGASGGDQGHGRQTRPARLPHAALRNEICRPRSRALRDTTPQTAGHPSQAKSRPARFANHRSCCSGLKPRMAVSEGSSWRDLTPTTRKWLIGHTKPFFLEADCLHGLLDDLEPMDFFHLTY